MLIARPTGPFDLIDQLLRRNRVRYIFVIVRSLGIELVLDVNAGDTSIDKFFDRAGHMQRLPEPRARIADDGRRDRPGDMLRRLDLFTHCEQRFADGARAAGNISADIGSIEPHILRQPAAQRVVNRGHIDEFLLLQKGAQP